MENYPSDTQKVQKVNQTGYIAWWKQLSVLENEEMKDMG